MELSVLLFLILPFVLAGCETTTFESAPVAQLEEKEVEIIANETVGELTLETEPQTEMPEETQPQEDEYFDIDSVAGEEVDYSKYEAENSVNNSGEESTNGNQDTSASREQQTPVEPENATVDKSKESTCYLSISCATLLDNMDKLTAGKESLIPSDGIIFAKREVTFYEGESVFDVLLRETQNNRIHMEYSFTPIYNSNYIEGINNLYEFDGGQGSGWMYAINGWYPNYGCSRYAVQDKDVIEFNYTCDLGRDLGTEWVRE